MPRFSYRAVTPAGQIHHGEMSAASQREAAARLQGLGQIPIRIELEGPAWLGSLTRERRAPGFRRPDELAAFIAELGILLRAGLPLDRAFEILRQGARRPADAAVPGQLLERIRRGASLADAMAEDPSFSPFCVSMVRAGELSGSLEAVLERLAGFLRGSAETQARIRSATTYPLIVLAVCGLSLAVLFIFVIPRFRPFFDDARIVLPLTTRALLALADLAQRYWWLLLALAAATGLGAAQGSRTAAGRRFRDAALLRLPVIGGLVRQTEAANFARVLGTLLKNGVPLTGGIRIAADTIRNQVIRGAIAEVGARVKEGKGLAGPLAETGAFPPLALSLIKVGEEAARLDDMLIEVATIHDFQTAHSLERLLALLGPALTVGLGLLVAFVIGSIMMAILSAYQLAI